MLGLINDREAFFKGMEVGRAMHGWRTPDSPSHPSGTKYIYQNGEYDVAQFETASVNVNQTNAISAEQVRELCAGAAYHFPVFTDNAKSLRVWVEFAEVTEKANGTADKATWHVHFSASANNENDTLGIMLDDGRNTLPDSGTHVADYIYTIMGNFITPLLGYHGLTFVDGNAGVTGCNVHVYSNEDIEYVRFGTLNAMSIDHDNTYGVQITGDGWASITGDWHAYAPVSFGVNLI